MIVDCPNCGARYRLSDAILARRARLRCAACDHRWVPDVPTAAAEPAVPAPPPPKPVTEADEEAAFAAVQEQMRARWQPPAPPVPEPAPPEAEAPPTEDDAAGDNDEPPRPAVVRTIVAIVAGLALAVAAAGLWLGGVDVDALPGVGPVLARFDPPSPLKVAMVGTVTELPGNRRILEVTGSIVNPAARPLKVPPLSARLAGPQGTVLRWTIAAPVAVLPPGHQVSFTSTVTGFPAEATTLGIRPGR